MQNLIFIIFMLVIGWMVVKELITIFKLRQYFTKLPWWPNWLKGETE